jgi:hypothetical protein
MRFRNCATLLLGLTVLAGCGGSSRPSEYVPVRGMVTLDGKPLPLKSICLYPEEGTAGLGAKALTKEDGSVELEAVVGGATKVIKGVVPGKYRVTVSNLEPDLGDPEALHTSHVRKPSITIPSVYSSSDSTPLNIEVTQGMSDIVLELSSKKR